MQPATVKIVRFDIMFCSLFSRPSPAQLYRDISENQSRQDDKASFPTAKRRNRQFLRTQIQRRAECCLHQKNPQLPELIGAFGSWPSRPVVRRARAWDQSEAAGAPDQTGPQRRDRQVYQHVQIQEDAAALCCAPTGNH
jgi:hypothetical protein